MTTMNTAAATFRTAHALARRDRASTRVVHRHASTSSEAPSRAQRDSIVERHDHPALHDEIELWVRRAGAANGFADIPAEPLPSGYDFWRAARTRRARMLAKLLSSMMRVAMATLRSAYAKYRSYRDARATYDALRGLDDRVLHDLGFTCSELESVVAEHYGLAERTRRRVE